MKLPNEIEKEIQAVEARLTSYIKQQAGYVRLHDLRWAIENYIREQRGDYR